MLRTTLLKTDLFIEYQARPAHSDPCQSNEMLTGHAAFAMFIREVVIWLTGRGRSIRFLQCYAML